MLIILVVPLGLVLFFAGRHSVNVSGHKKQFIDRVNPSFDQIKVAIDDP